MCIRDRLVASDSSSLHILYYVFDVCRGPVIPPSDLGLVAVIDGRNVKITPLRIANIPPPMAFDEVVLPAPAVDAVFNERSKELAVLNDTQVTVWEFDYSTRPAKKARLLQTVARDESHRGWGVNVLPDGTLRIARSKHDRIAYSSDTDEESKDTVSYTHLTLPTIYSV